MGEICFSMESGRRLCNIKGGKLNGECIYLYDSRFVCCGSCGAKCAGKCCDDCSKKNYHIKNNKSIGDNIEYCHLEGDAVFQQVPNNIKSQSDVLMINGKRGAGKSVYTASFLEQYKLFYPKNKIYLFSQCKKDPVLDKIIDQRFELDTYVKDGGVVVDDFPDSCCVCFDDVDMLDNTKPEKLRDAIFKIMNSLIQLSRKRNITVIQTSHLTTNHGETKHALNGASSFTFFLSAMSHQVRNALKLYMGLSRENIKKVCSLKNSRWCTIFTTCPTVVMTEKELMILKE
jgi:hypothetical protein